MVFTRRYLPEVRAAHNGVGGQIGEALGARLMFGFMTLESGEIYPSAAITPPVPAFCICLLSWVFHFVVVWWWWC
jgi:ATP/ADP translocase